MATKRPKCWIIQTHQNQIITQKKSKRSQTKIRLNYSFSRERTNQQMTVNVRKCANPDHKMKSDNAASKTQPNQHKTASVSRTNWHGINQVTIIVEPIKPNGHQIDPRLESIDEGNQMLTAFHGISAPPPPSLFTLVSSYANELLICIRSSRFDVARQT